MKISALLTCHNRMEKTIACLDALYRCPLPEGCSLHIVLVDDGSTDGTGTEVAKRYPEVTVHFGNGSLFWNRGMHEAQIIAMRSQPDYVLWLNDDTVLVQGALETLMETGMKIESKTTSPAIIVGATFDRCNGEMTYGGAVSRSRLRRFDYRRVWDSSAPAECQVMNGNVVLIPRSIADAVGNIDPAFEHAMGDLDYALRAREAGFEIYVAPSMIGYCSRNPPPSIDYGSNHSLREKWAAFKGRKRLPPKSWLRFTRRHGGVLWPAYFVQPYAWFLFRAIRASLTHSLNSNVRRS